MSSSSADFQAFLSSRRSIRKFQPRGIDDDLLRAVVEAAQWAPSAHNRQPWRLVLVTDPEVKLRLAATMAERLRADRLADGDDIGLIDADVRRSLERLQKAAAVIVVLMSMEAMDRYTDERRNALEHIMAVQSTAMAGQNMLLMAHKLGLGACWICAPLFADREALEVLECPPEWKPQGLITLGWPESIPDARDRLPLDEVIRWI